MNNTGSAARSSSARCLSFGADAAGQHDVSQQQGDVGLTRDQLERDMSVRSFERAIDRTVQELDDEGAQALVVFDHRAETQQGRAELLANTTIMAHGAYPPVPGACNFDPTKCVPSCGVSAAPLHQSASASLLRGNRGTFRADGPLRECWRAGERGTLGPHVQDRPCP